MKEIEVSARKVEDAIADGLRQLDTTIDNVTIEILSQGGFLKKAKIRMRVNEPAEKEIKPAQQPRKETSEDMPRKQQQDKRQPKPNAAEANNSSKDNRPKDFEKPKTETAPRDKRPERPESDNAPRDKRPERPESDNAPRDKRPEKPNAEKPRPVTDKKERTENIVKTEVKNDNEKPVKSEKPERAEHVKPQRECVEEKPIDPETKNIAANFLNGLFEKMGIKVDVSIEANTELNIDLVCEEMKLIGYRGSTLEALTALVSAVVNKGKDYVPVNVDNNNYHKEREQSLIDLAHKKADRCVRMRKKVVLEPMSSRDRKIIHSALGDDDRITTRSKGQEPNRRVIIYPKNDKRPQ